MCVIFGIIGIVLSLVGGPARIEGCVAVPKSSCSYVATVPGGYQATGTGWQIELVRDGHRTVFGPGSPSYRANVIQPGDHVSAWVGPDVYVARPNAATGVVRVGPGLGN